MAADVLSQTPPTVQTAHLLDPAVPVAGQARLVAARLRGQGSATFHELVADAGTTAVVVSRFLALLELFRRVMVEFSQEEALGQLTVTWVGPDAEVDLDVDEYEGDPEAEEAQV